MPIVIEADRPTAPPVGVGPGSERASLVTLEVTPLGPLGIEAITDQPGLVAQLLHRAVVGLIGQLLRGGRPRGARIIIDLPRRSSRRLSQPAPDRVALRRRDPPAHQRVGERRMPRGRRGSIARRDRGWIRLQQPVARLENRLPHADPLTCVGLRRARDRLHELSGVAVAAHLHEPLLPRLAPGTLGHDARADRLDSAEASRRARTRFDNRHKLLITQPAHCIGELVSTLTEQVVEHLDLLPEFAEDRHASSHREPLTK